MREELSYKVDELFVNLSHDALVNKGFEVREVVQTHMFRLRRE